MAQRHGDNEGLLRQLQKYLPEGCIGENDPIPVRGKGSWYEDADGKLYLDFSSGIFTNTFGHACDRLAEAGYEQAKRLGNIHGRHSEAELRFYERLYRYLPEADYKAVCYNDGGYTIDRGITDIIYFYDKQKIGIAAYRNGFHGKTQAVKLLINETEQAAFYHNFQVEFPDCYRCCWGRQKSSCDMECVRETCKLLKREEARAIVFEPVQGAGIIVPPEGYWKMMESFCREQGILMFADEVLTGGGRVGCYLACGYFGITPDMIALTKGLANGKPLSVLLERERITRNRFAGRPMERLSTFAAHPEALAVAAELLTMLEEENIMENVQKRGKLLAEGLSELAERFSVIGEARSLGLMAAVEFVRDRKTKEPFCDMGRCVFEICRKNGLETIGNGHILRLAPPLNIAERELQEGIGLLGRSIAEALVYLNGGKE